MRNFFVLLLLLILAGCQTDTITLNGYVEGEYTYVTTTTSGLLKELNVQRGDVVKSQDQLFAIDDTELTASVISSKAAVEDAESNLNNMLKGQRIEEIQVLLTQKEEIQAKIPNIKKEYARAKSLIKSQIISRSEFDQKESDYKTVMAQLDQILAQLKVAQLGAREDEIKSAEARLIEAQQNLIQVQKKLDDSSPKTKNDARVEDTFFLPSEFVQVGMPVVSLLSPKNIKIRFFIPQAQLSKISSGKKVTVSWDGCKNPVEAKITFISHIAEYTPPIIYSTNARQKIVFLVEARPVSNSIILNPGLPVDIKILMQ